MKYLNFLSNLNFFVFLCLLSFSKSQDYYALQYMFPSPFCESSQYLIPNTDNSCHPCPSDCSSCYFNALINDVYCSKCSLNYGIVLSPQRKCVVCPPGCSNCFYFPLKNGRTDYEGFNTDLKVLYNIEDKCILCPKIGDTQLIYSNVCFLVIIFFYIIIFLARML
jgi:hypothetical protein